MLSKFSIENYKSIKDRISLDMNTSNITGLEKNIIQSGSSNLLKSVSILGPNASGKSNLLDGFVIMRYLVINSAKNIQAKEILPVHPFRLSTATEYAPSLFEVEIILKTGTYIYGFRANPEKVQQEWLLQKLKTTTKVIFTRENNKFTYGKVWKKNKELERFSRSNALFLSVTAQWNIKLAEEILEWFWSVSTLHGLSFHSYTNISVGLMENKNTKSLIIDLMKKADLGIENIKAKPLKTNANLGKNKYLYKNKIPITNNNKRYDILTYHNKYNETGKIVGEVEFNLLREESDGTRKFFSLIGAILEAFVRGELVIIDEFDARLHPDLVNEVINLFNSKKNKKGQLICVNFNTAILDNKLLRRDQVYLIEKDNFGASKMNSMVEYDIRKGQPMEKHYREGRVGGKPIIENFETIF